MKKKRGRSWEMAKGKEERRKEKRKDEEWR